VRSALAPPSSASAPVPGSARSAGGPGGPNPGGPGGPASASASGGGGAAPDPPAPQWLRALPPGPGDAPFRLSGAWLQMCLDAGVWPGLWAPLLALRDGRAVTWRGPGAAEPSERPYSPGLAPHEAAGFTADAPAGCSEASVITLRTFNVASLRAARPAPAAVPRVLNLVVRVVALHAGGEVNDCASVEDPTGAMACILTRQCAEALGGALGAGAVLMLLKVSVAVLGGCQALVVRPENVMRCWPAETPDPRHALALAGAGAGAASAHSGNAGSRSREI